MISFITLSRDIVKCRRLWDNLRQVFADALIDRTYVQQQGNLCGGEVYYRSTPVMRERVDPWDGWQLIRVCGTQFDLFEGYDRGAAAAVDADSPDDGQILCFLHDDVELRFHIGTLQTTLDLLRRPATGIVGVAGTRLLPADGCWWHSPQDQCRGAVSHPNLDEPFGEHLNVWPHQGARYGRVVTVDGVLMLMRKGTWRRLGGFKTGYLTGFHLYDTDICVRAHLAGLQNYVAPLPIFHASPGRPDAQYEVNRRLLAQRYRQHLPLHL